MISGTTRRETDSSSFRLEALLYIHQVEALELAKRELQQAKQIGYGQEDGAIASLLRVCPEAEFAATTTRQSLSQDEGMGMTSTLKEANEARSRQIDLDLSNESEGIGSIGGVDPLEPGVPHSVQNEETRLVAHPLWRSQESTPRQHEHEAHQSDCSASLSTLGSWQETPSGAASCSPPIDVETVSPLTDLETLSRQELKEEVMRLHKSLESWNKSMLSIQKNADLKAQQLELKVLFLERKLADEQVMANSLLASNQALKRELQAAFTQAKDHDDTYKMKKMVNLHRKELAMEKHVNSLRIARNKAVHQNTLLERMLLQTCYECRKKLPIKKTGKNSKPPRSQKELSPSQSSSPQAINSSASATSLGNTCARSRRTDANNESYVPSSGSSFSSSPVIRSSTLPETTGLAKFSHMSISSIELTEEDDESTGASMGAVSCEAPQQSSTNPGGVAEKSSKNDGINAVGASAIPLVRSPKPTHRHTVEASSSPSTPSTSPSTAATAPCMPTSHTLPERHSGRPSPKPRWLRVFTGEPSSFHSSHKVLPSNSLADTTEETQRRLSSPDRMEQSLKQRQNARMEKAFLDQALQLTNQEHSTRLSL